MLDIHISRSLEYGQFNCSGLVCPGPSGLETHSLVLPTKYCSSNQVLHPVKEPNSRYYTSYVFGIILIFVPSVRPFGHKFSSICFYLFGRSDSALWTHLENKLLKLFPESVNFTAQSRSTLSRSGLRLAYTYQKLN